MFADSIMCMLVLAVFFLQEFEGIKVKSMLEAFRRTSRLAC